MEKILNQILDRLAKLEQGQTRLEQGQTRLEQGQAKLEQGQTKLEQGQHRITRRLDAVFEQTAGLLEWRTETIEKLDALTKGQEKISNDIEILAGELGKQKLDIERLKKRPV